MSKRQVIIIVRGSDGRYRIPAMSKLEKHARYATDPQEALSIFQELWGDRADHAFRLFKVKEAA